MGQRIGLVMRRHKQEAFEGLINHKKMKNSMETVVARFERYLVSRDVGAAFSKWKTIIAEAKHREAMNHVFQFVVVRMGYCQKKEAFAMWRKYREPAIRNQKLERLVSLL